ncbi:MULTISPECIES: glycerol-3-phosphate 1-O-acyltransferase PlsY [Shewanella]|uniref:Glycerol-3-phosphate acyltransferase n=2 Tax=Shewanella psychromarinicola TaxID=2487742 RepID=A0A3N4EFH6_9GAMM|nr:glycerol-3-phosphate 1-O-acyltransferase PlsY [Shewanella psychromarinicola]AZG35218.1 glycerol-3-phosphate 1-O-acyltransferase PlsY [Shewanella psychromarinicola]MCL1082625.1 glycerol-3-phosphate 1-O-acyltransferase PlsY [Shewanella psychromarinicola]RPA32980.1 glycerol-3-phosphate 1-O-acyltransferase PlsY [Shewanella psychromarinicola]
MNAVTVTILMIIAAYLAGSISSAVLVCKIRGLPDPRTSGSGNPGATNVLRIGGVSSAAMVLFFDMLKGALPSFLGYKMGLDAVSLGFIAVSACLGHILPIFFGFKGGKGVATAFGAMAPIGGDLAICLILTWIVFLLLTRYSSVAAMATATLAPLYTWWLDERFILPVAMLSTLILIRHKDNIGRLRHGEESKVSRKKAIKKPNTN